MTAEIAVMNKSAVALAADSAVTIKRSNSSNHHVYHGVNKLFELTHGHPIAVMIYDSAEFMGIPWETIIKTYRLHLKNNRYDELESYVSDFISFLEKDKKLITPEERTNHVKKKIAICFRSIRKTIDKLVEKYIKENDSITDAKIREIKSREIIDVYKSLAANENLENLPKSFKTNFVKKYRKSIDIIRKEVFKKHTITQDLSRKLDLIGAFLFYKNAFHFEKSGLVFTGYGEKEKYPKLVSLQVECIANDKLKYSENKSAEISLENNASIVAFAQKDMVTSFMEGIHPQHRVYIEKNLSRLLEHILPDYVAKEICNLKDEQKKIIESKLKKIGKGILKEFDKELRRNRLDEFVYPITSSVSHLPKDELAAMAESLVNLTSFRQKISLGTSGTVGGEIDVAVISKGDGFIWIKRNHYFEPKLNPHFMAKYLNINCNEE